MTGRLYDPERDLSAITRAWRPAGWIDTSGRQAAALAVGHTVVADVHGSAECLEHRAPGTVQYGLAQHVTDLDLSLISAVITGQVARRRGRREAPGPWVPSRTRPPHPLPAGIHDRPPRTGNHRLADLRTPPAVGSGAGRATRPAPHGSGAGGSGEPVRPS